MRVVESVVLSVVLGGVLPAAAATAADPPTAAEPTVAWVQATTSVRAGGLWVQSAGTAPRRLAPLPRDAAEVDPFTLGFVDVRVSPDGRHVAYGRYPEEHTGSDSPGLTIADVTTGRSRSLPGGGGVSWSADARFVATTSRTAILRCAVATGRCTRWARLPGDEDVSDGGEGLRATGIAISPDGSRLAYVPHGGDEDPEGVVVLSTGRRVVRHLRAPAGEILSEAVGWTQTGPLVTGIGLEEEGTLLRPAGTRSRRLRVAAHGDQDRDVGEAPTVLGVTSSGRFSLGDRLDGDAGELPYEVQLADLRHGGVRVLARGEGVASAGIAPDGGAAAYSPDGRRIVLRGLPSGAIRTLVDAGAGDADSPLLVLPSAAWPAAAASPH
ncbi:hypothetical protein AB0L40_16995 [Patulibacter sp. NPDC049589]|uniref:hypothetical protein n=1 Tax=Patulibacter sp. NPDC049589 TaxID=3154731 RepID=UPI003413CE0B